MNNGSLDNGQDFVALVDLMGAAVGDVPGGIVYGAGGPGLIDGGNEVNHVAPRSSRINVCIIACTEPGTAGCGLQPSLYI